MPQIWPTSDAALREYCDRNYHQLLPITAEKVHQENVHQEKLKAVKARLNFEEASQHSESGTPSKRGTSRKGSDLDVSAACPKALSQGATILSHQGKKESIDSYDDLKNEFLENYLQQKKCIKDLVEIHNIKQRDRESRKSLCGGPMIIEAEMGGHFVHHMYMDGGSSSKILVSIRLTIEKGANSWRNKAIYEEVENLVDVGIIKEVHYHSWLSNPGMVKKHDYSGRMCVDFKDLNKACLKDGYPLPEIDWK
nr:reverse transcriptase domain-containing protein [Tanacetum cinerariifolium]